MKPRVLALVLSLSLLLTGCGWLDGSYTSVKIHRENRPASPSDAVSAANKQELRAALEDVIDMGVQMAAIKVGQYPEEKLTQDVILAVRYAMDSYPIGAYAVENIDYEIGTSVGEPAVAVNITYRRSAAELKRIRKVRNMENVAAQVKAALYNCDASLVMAVEEYRAEDVTQVVEDYAADYPQVVMEIPKVTELTHGSGNSRVLEISFAYQNSRDDLKNMQAQVKPVFDAAMLYVSNNAEERQKFSQLYSFLMERFDYKVETSLTPAYSLLHHGVGDSKAFAQVYAAICRSKGLTCMTVTGTCNAEPRTWNMVKENDCYYHVDLLHCNEIGAYRTRTDAEMEGYVWDYSAYPVCDGKPEKEMSEK